MYLSMRSPKCKAFVGGIVLAYCGVIGFFYGYFYLAGYSDMLLSNYASRFYHITMVMFGLSGFFVLWGAWQYKRNKLPFKTDRTTKIVTYTELGVSIAGFSLLGVGAYLRSIFDTSNPDLLLDFNQRTIPHPYQEVSFTLLHVAFLLVLIALAMYYFLLPKQIKEPAA